MGFRLRRSIRLGPFRLNFAKSGLSSLSIGRPGATVNVPIARQGGTRATVGLPGTGLNYSAEQGRPGTSQRRNQQRHGSPQAIPSTEGLIAELRDALLETGDCLWRQNSIGLVGHLLERDDTGPQLREQLALIVSLDRAELHVRRGRTQADTIRRMKQVCSAVRAALDQGRELGWVQEAG